MLRDERKSAAIVMVMRRKLIVMVAGPMHAANAEVSMSWRRRIEHRASTSTGSSLEHTPATWSPYRNGCESYRIVCLLYDWDPAPLYYRKM